MNKSISINFMEYFFLFLENFQKDNKKRKK